MGAKPPLASVCKATFEAPDAMMRDSTSAAAFTPPRPMIAS